ncbi:alpha/beta fold hydrolase [Undibacterium sp. RuRC25W]|uniref:alpha/beta fold hydrolase n=1 Tax=Undibacterium sp. RuRC25W TaxID=3413047 RepID=UPI003BF299DC
MTSSHSLVTSESRSEFVTIRGLQYHVRHWGKEGAPLIVMLHGWMDVSASFQFVVDHLQHDWHVIAPDLRGFGLTETPGTDTYWFPDYLGDLDALLDHYAPQGPINLLGHSMGANVVGLYAGTRPERVRRLVNLEGFGMPTTSPEQAPGRYRQWLDELRQKPALRTYGSQAEVAARLQKTNPRLSHERAAFLSSFWAKENAQGRWEILGDPAHKQTSPLLFHVEEVMACWQQITAPVLWMQADDTNVWHWMGAKDQAQKEIDRRLAHIPHLQKEMIADAGHMLHHDQPMLLAQLIEDFLLK